MRGFAITSLKNKIILLTCASVLTSTLLVGGINYFRVETVILDTAVEKLAGETRLMAQRFKYFYDQMESDVQVLSKTPPIQGIIRSAANAGVDPEDGSTAEVWNARLGTIFASIMAARPHYTQIRYIGLADRGRELVRVDRSAAGIAATPRERLQEKGAEPYFQAGLATAPGGIHFSEVTYNRERGVVDGSLTPTVRAVKPIFDAEGRIFGMIVINAHYADMLRASLEKIAPKDNTIVLNSSGDYIEYASDGTIGSFEFHDNYSARPPAFFANILGSELDEQAFTADDSVSYFVRAHIDPDNPDAFLGVVVRTPLEKLLRSASEVRRVSLALSALVILVCVAVSLILARKFTAPLNRMTKAIKHSSGGGSLEDLPLERADEIGDLARAFDQKTQELAANEAKLTAIVDNTVDGLITIDQYGAVETFNRACETIFGYAAEEVIGRNVKMLMPAPYHDEHDGYLKHHHDTGERRIIGIGREVEGRRRDGSVFPLDLSVSAVRVEDRTIYSGIIRDISERKQIETMKNEFISTVSHELRTPLTAIQGSLGLLVATSGERIGEKGRKLLQISYDNCQRLSRLVNDILDIERIAAGKMEYDLEVVDICRLVGEIVERQVSFAEKYGVEFAPRFDALEARVLLDQDRFTQALINLLSNAAKFSHRGDRVEIVVSMKSASEVLVSVRDHGPGVPESFHGKIFGKFAQADGSSARMKGGSGLGLNITRKIIEALDGTVDFETEEGKGSVFTFTLPLAPAERMTA